MYPWPATSKISSYELRASDPGCGVRGHSGHYAVLGHYTPRYYALHNICYRLCWQVGSPRAHGGILIAEYHTHIHESCPSRLALGMGVDGGDLLPSLEG